MTILKIVAVSLVTALVTVFFLIPNLIQGKTVPQETPKLSHQQIVYIHRIEWCESRGKADIKILDSNNRFSYSVLQFQMATFLSKGKEYGLIATSTTAKQGEKLIYNVELQEAIAHRMLLEGGMKHWYTCTKNMGMYPTTSP